MNYLEFFELHQEPFSNAPVARFYFDSESHSRALIRLRYSVEQSKGLAVLVGDIGAGKTTLARRLLDSLPEEQFEAALLMIVHAETTQQWLLSRIALLLGVESPSDDKLRLLSQVYQRLVAIHEAGRKAVILIDEAQMLRSKDLMEEFRGLLNLELTEKKLLTFVFFGLPELDENLKLDPPLAGRVALRVRLDPLSRASTAAYIAHRLKLAGARRSLFNDAAVDSVHRASHGTPRLINTVCDNALLESFFVKRAQVDADVVDRVAQDLGLITAVAVAEPRETISTAAPLSRAASGSFAAAPAPAAPLRAVEQPSAPPAPPRVVAPPPVAPAPRAPFVSAPPPAISAPPPIPAPRPRTPSGSFVAAPAPAPALPPSAPVVASGEPARPVSGPFAAAVSRVAAASAVPPPAAQIPEHELPEAEIAESISPMTAAPVPAPGPASATGGARAAIEAIDEMEGDEEVEIPQIDALDDIDSILDQLEDKSG